MVDFNRATYNALMGEWGHIGSILNQFQPCLSLPTMGQSAEIPDQHVVTLAEQFLATAELLLENIPHVVAPSALRVNAAFAVELFIKSLNSRWVYQNEDDEPDSAIEDSGELEDIMGYIVTTQPNTFGHNLSKLFAALPEALRDDIATHFASHSLSSLGTIEQALSLYSETFERERYPFERWKREPYESKPGDDIVELARFFRDYVASVPRVRY